MKPVARPCRTKPLFLGAFLLLSLSGCGGGGGSGEGEERLLSDSTNDRTPAVQSTALAPPDSARPFLGLPSTVANGSTVELECGRVYQGSLDLRNKTNVAVRTVGDCGKAVLTTGRAITGWTRHEGNVYSAPVSFDAAQVVVDSQPVSKAHWPNRTQTWVKANAATSTSLSYSMPNADLVGATLLFRPNDWAMEERRITAYSNGTMSVASTGNYEYDGYGLGGPVDFYVEGKLWMLDEPGEWALSNGRLYLWTQDGRSPEGRTWAFPAVHGIEAPASQDVSIDGVRIYGAANGINAVGARGLRVSNVEIANSSGSGIVNHGGTGLFVDRASIRNARHDGISVHWGGGNEIIQNSRIDAAGVIGMPVNSRAAINLTATSGSLVAGNHVTNAGYIGIRVFRNATVRANTVDGACIVLTDCGGVFTFARDQLALNTRIEDNVIRNIGPTQRFAWGIYLSEYANAVNVSGNTVSNTGNGVNIFNGFNIALTGNAFSNSRQAHIEITEDASAPTVRRIDVNGNRFTSIQGEETYRNSSNLGAASVAQFGTFDANTFVSSSPRFANFNGQALNFEQWKTRTGQDGSSTMRAP